MRPMLLACATALAGCESSVVVGDLQEITALRAVGNRDLDILFVVDNSGSMIEQQASLAANFGRMIDVLAQLDGGLPNLHIGVVTSDLGTSTPAGIAPPVGTLGSGGCADAGDDGVLHAGQFLSDIGLPDGTRARNYVGNLRDVFGELALVGATGCGFEQHLAAMRRALGNPANVGFLRPDANLAVVIIADEDDCSARSPALFAADGEPLESYRCTQHGLRCAEGLSAPGTKTGCVPDDSSPLVEDVQPFIDALLATKADPRSLLVAAIVGPPSPVEVTLRSVNGVPALTLTPSCIFDGPAGPETADPAVRLAAFVDAFPGRATLTSICNGDLSSALAEIGESAKKLVGDPCLDAANLADASTDPGLQPACEVVDVRDARPEAATPLARCASGASDCFEITSDAVACPTSPDHLRVRVRRSSTPSPDTWTHVRCQVAR